MFIQSFYQPSRSLADRLFNAEFDDALVDQAPWKYPRYEGSKLFAKKINHYTEPEFGISCGIGCASVVGNEMTNYNPGVGSMVIGGGAGGITTFTVGGYLLSIGLSTQPEATGNPGTFTEYTTTYSVLRNVFTLPAQSAGTYIVIQLLTETGGQFGNKDAYGKVTQENYNSYSYIKV